MLLALDVGNTTIGAGLVRAGALVASRRLATRSVATSDELELALDGLLHLDGFALGDVSALVVASVVPALSAPIEAFASRRAVPLLVAGAGTVPLPIRVERPADVGADRLVSAFAAVRRYGAPAIVVDLGSATTWDCVGHDGAFVGGAIAPGLELGLEALADRTAKLPRVEPALPDRAIGRDTASAIRSGAVLGYRGLLTSVLDAIRRELADAAGIAPQDVHVVLTGGLSTTDLARSIEGVEAIDPDLVLTGLALLHAEVAAGQPLGLGLT